MRGCDSTLRTEGSNHALRTCSPRMGSHQADAAEQAAWRSAACTFMMRRSRCAASCVDGPRLARDNFACRTEVACSHVSGLFTQSGWTAGPDGVREPSPHHSNGIDVPMKRQVWLG